MPQCWKCGAPPCPPDLPPSVAPSVDLTRLIASNDAPETSEIPSVLHAISDIQNRINTLDGQIAQISRERDEAVENLRQHKAIFSPVRRVPPELLCEIFLFTLPWYRNLDEVAVHQPPWRLGHVCASWRDVAIAYPPLWKFLQVEHSSDVLASEMYPISALQTTLLRAANLPLDVTFEWWYNKCILNPRWLDVFLEHCNRWAVVRIHDYSYRGSFLDILRRVRGRLPELQKLEILHPGFGDDPEELADHFLVAPSLREVILANPKLTDRSVGLPIPWNQITYYRGVYTPARQFQILQAAPNLVECGLGFSEGPLDQDQVVTLPSLRRLYSKNTGFLSHLRLPSLEALFLIQDADLLPSLIQCSSCRLTKLVLTDCELAPTFSTILRCIPILTYLLLEVLPQSRENIPPLFNAMTLSGSPSDLCPNLTSFVFGERPEFSSENPLFPMIQSRLSPHSLSFFRLFHRDPFYDIPHATVLAGIQELADGGLDAAFISSEPEVEALTEMSWSNPS
ncbi:hypothetical protein DFH09DRAFT_974224 [Mycena vulgaris]|nr:hypothetical protein DFH09DRAFT_974224 [Mycena vulgaris]